MFALVFAFVFSILMDVCVDANANFHLFVIVKVCWCLVICFFSFPLYRPNSRLYFRYLRFISPSKSTFFSSSIFILFSCSGFYSFGSFGLAIFFRLMVVCIRRNQRRQMLYLSLSVFESISFAPLWLCFANKMWYLPMVFSVFVCVCVALDFSSSFCVCVSL